MDLIADSVKLEGFEGFCGGLNMKSNHTETEFYYTQLKDRREIISQLCSLLSATINSSCSSRLWQNTSAAKTLTVPVPFKNIIMIQHQNFFGCNSYLSYSTCLCKLFLLFTKAIFCRWNLVQRSRVRVKLKFLGCLFHVLAKPAASAETTPNANFDNIGLISLNLA